MKFKILFLSLLLSFSVQASIPTEEGLLRNLNNPEVKSGQTIIRFKVKGQDETKPEAYYKITLSSENPNAVQVLQQKFSSVQMLPNQVKDMKLEMDLLARLRREKPSEKNLFYSVLIFLAFNRPQGMENLIEKSGGTIVRTKSLVNEEKMRLLRNYRSYLTNSKSKGEADSPLNPSDAREKQRTQDLFRSNTLKSSPNVKLTKIGSEFLWHADWKTMQAFFTNEERRLRIVEFSNSETNIKAELDQYAILNGMNEFPRSMLIQAKDASIYRIQVIGVETKATGEKQLPAKFEEMKKFFTDATQKEEADQFLF